MKKKRPHKQVSPDRFVEVYINSASVAEAAKTLGLSRPTVYHKAAILRAAGVDLPYKNNFSEAIDVEKLNRLVDQGK